MPVHQTRDSLSGTASEANGEPPPAQLTAKETQTLMWFFKGKTSWEIARIQNCSESTVNFHFANIRRKFAVNSRSAALLKAIDSGAISVGETSVRGVHEPD